MYWRWNRIPELADLPPEERKRLWSEAKRDPFRPSDILWLGIFLGVCIVGAIALIYLPKNLSIWISLPIFLAVAFGVGAIFDAMLISRYRPIVRRLRGGG
jgi:hypothetical protein